jgi:CRP-like cAMP-binding protein
MALKEAGIRTISPLERVLTLKRVAPLRSMTPEQLAILAQESRERVFERGATIYGPGEPLTSFHVIVEGQVRVLCAEHGERQLEREEILGLLSVLARWEEGVEAVAETEVRSLEIDADVLEEIFEDHFDILLSEIRSLACRTLEIRRTTPEGTYFAPAADRPVPPRGLDLVQRLQFLRRNPLFERANIDVLLRLANGMEEVHLPAGEVLWEPEEPSGTLLALLDGRVRCDLPDGRHFVCGPGYPLGNLESQCGAPRWYRATAETDVFALRGRTEVFFDILEDHFEMARQVLAHQASALIRLLVETCGTAQGSRNMRRSEDATSSPPESATTRQ